MEKNNNWAVAQHSFRYSNGQEYTARKAYQYHEEDDDPYSCGGWSVIAIGLSEEEALAMEGEFYPDEM